jgi:hypothetical protein
MYGFTRGVLTGIAAGVAGFLIYIAAAWVDGGTTGAYWARVGLVAAAGLVMALSQLVGGWTKGGFPKVSPNVFLWGFVPVLVAAGWVLLFSQPTNSVQSHISTWSADIGLRDVCQNLRDYVGVLAFGLGLVFGFTFDTSGPRRRREVVTRDGAVAADRAGRPEDEPVLRDRQATDDRPRVAGRGFLGRRRREPVATDGTPVDETTDEPTTTRTR